MNQLEEILHSKKLSIRLVDKKVNTSNRLIEQMLKDNSDIIETAWINRHAKFCYKHGLGAYEELVRKARKYGKEPKVLLAYLVNREI